MHLPVAGRASRRSGAQHRSLIGRLQNDTRPGHLPQKWDGRRLIGGPSKRRGQGDILNRCRPPVCPARAWVRARTVAVGRVSVGEQRRGLFFSQPRLVSWLSAVSGMGARPFGYFCGYLILPSTRIVTTIAGKNLTAPRWPEGLQGTLPGSERETPQTGTRLCIAQRTMRITIIAKTKMMVLTHRRSIPPIHCCLA